MPVAGTERDKSAAEDASVALAAAPVLPGVALDGMSAMSTGGGGEGGDAGTAAVVTAIDDAAAAEAYDGAAIVPMS